MYIDDDNDDEMMMKITKNMQIFQKKKNRSEFSIHLRDQE